ncbi:MAG: hypothetical protein Q8M65_08285 [Rhodoglobus sp.]|nr:hypothetical protein [Rhodoglobus sp.]
MSSWRDGVSAGAQAELDSLLDSSLSVARRNLDHASEFDPFAVFMREDGRLIHVEYSKESKGKPPTVETILRNLLEQLRALAADARCTAIILNSRLDKERTDALEVRLEHKDGGSLVVLLPYKRALFGGATEYGQLRGFASKRLVWA